MRKQPSQQRSRDLVATLLEATARTIVSHGLDGVTTNHIAEAAGVSVGSLYQYFDSKDEIIEALLEQRMTSLMLTIQQLQMQWIDQAPRDITRSILMAIFDTVERDQCLRVLTGNWDHLRSRNAFRVMEQHMIEACRFYLMRHHDRFRIANLPAVLFVAINSVQYTVAYYLSMKHTLLPRDEVIDALSDMLDAYLQSMAIA